jgi:hypothetical protein
MSRVILDEQLSATEVASELKKWCSVLRLKDLRPQQQILDDRVIEMLLTLNRPTFVTIDRGFWKRGLCHPGYCILYFVLASNRQEALSERLRALFRRREFRTRAARMGKVVRVSPTHIDYWQFLLPRPKRIVWTGG